MLPIRAYYLAMTQVSLPPSPQSALSPLAVRAIAVSTRAALPYLPVALPLARVAVGESDVICDLILQTLLYVRVFVWLCCVRPS